jgi:hypothetical protein
MLADFGGKGNIESVSNGHVYRHATVELLERFGDFL